MDDIALSMIVNSNVSSNLAALTLTIQPRNMSTALMIIPQPRTYNYLNRLNVYSLDDDECMIRFRFNIHEIQRIISAMNLPNTIRSDNGSIIDTVTAMCMLLRRLAYPNRYWDISQEFGYDNTMVCRFILTLVTILDNKYRSFITLWPGITTQRVIHYSNIITTKFNAIQQIWGAIDGAFRASCRPTHNQKLLFSGHKRMHGQKFQSIVTPDGLIVSLWGPELGKSHDLTLLRESNIMNILQPHVIDNDTIYFLYGDSAYSGQKYIMSPTSNDTTYNSYMSKMRIIVEWGFSKVIQYFSYIDYKKQMKLELSPTAAEYKLAVLFTNIHTCLRQSSLTIKLFNSTAPTI